MKKIFCAIACFAGAAILAQTSGIDPYKTNPWNLIKEKKYDEAETVFDLRIKDPNCSKDLKGQAINGIFGLQFQKKQLAKGVELFDKYLTMEELKEFRPQLLQNKARFQVILEKYDDALKTYKEAAELTSGKPEQLNILRYAFAISGNYKYVKEMPYFLDFALANPHGEKDILFLIAASEVCWRLNRATDGLNFARKAEKIMTTPDLNVYRVLGYHLRATQEFEKAEQAFLKAVELSKTEADKATLYRNIGENWERAEEYEKAITFYKKAADSPAKGWWNKSAANSIIRLQKKIDAGE